MRSFVLLPLSAAAILFFLSSAFAQMNFWQLKSSAVGLNVGINPLNPWTVYCERTSGVLSVSRDKGQTWTDLPASPGISGIREIYVHPHDTMTIFVAEFFDVGLMKTTDEGVTWRTVLPSYGIDGESIDVDPSHPDTMYAGKYSDGSVYRSTDRGETWNLQGISGPHLCGLIVRPDSANIVYAGTGSSTISKSTDEGVTWRMVNNGGTDEVPKFAINPQHPLIGYAVTFGLPDTLDNFWKTTDGGETWFKTGLQKVGVWSIAIDVQHPETLLVGRFGTTVGIERTTDGGATFQHYENGLLPNFAAWNMHIHPLAPSEIWVAGTINFFGQGGVFRFTDSSENSLSQGWNMISVPVATPDARRTTLYPNASSMAFTYAFSYTPVDSLRSGIGYWLKFPADSAIVVTGDPVSVDTISLNRGWNMIGSVSAPVAVNTINSIPPGMITSQFFGYSGSYAITDTIFPGKAYWVKVDTSGELVLGGGGGSTAHRIRVTSLNEKPPSPPSAEGAQVQTLPPTYALEQSYPNPFNPSTTIRYQLPSESHVSIKVYNVAGQVVAVLRDGIEPAGFRSVTWDASGFASGIYFYDLITSRTDKPAESFSQVRKMMLIK
ncbi:MAG TPA: T9SS type A sorting domain-containing protein [Bacteroidota bacterium]|nr:T9SS type A sorting domain-containing protein [Bacteroidota bacterium]